jgi:fucose 4-O-acetylase-like acetyltransferase
MNRKNMPLLLMLIAGACTWIVTLVRSYSLLASLVALFTVMLLFYCLGSATRLASNE